VDLSVAHEMKAIGGHPDSLRWAFYEVADRLSPQAIGMTDEAIATGPARGRPPVDGPWF
jgi:hypothetical protein